jgi:hypothetical protein
MMASGLTAYVATREGWLYVLVTWNLAVDLASRRVVGWAMFYRAVQAA